MVYHKVQFSDHYYLFYILTIYLIMSLVELNYLLTILKFTLPSRTILIATLLLQKNLDMVNEWSHKWLLKFNVDKCKLLQLGNSSPANYYLSSSDGFSRPLICKVTEEKDLGVWCTSDMKPSLQVQKAVTKAMQTLSMLKRSFRFLLRDSFLFLYRTYIRPHLEYCAPSWSLHLAKDIDALE